MHTDPDAASPNRSPVRAVLFPPRTMFILYLFALLVGAGLLGYSFFGHSHTDAAGAGDVGHADGDVHAGDGVQWLSFRSLTYALFVFGGVGAVLAKSWPAGTAPLVFAIAIAAGAGIGALVSAVFGYLRRTSTGDRESDDSFVGLSGRMTLPFGAAGVGKVLITRGDRTFELLARPFDTSRGDSRSWKAVVVVEMNQSGAVVAPADDPRVRELASINP